MNVSVVYGSMPPEAYRAATGTTKTLGNENGAQVQCGPAVQPCYLIIHLPRSMTKICAVCASHDRNRLSKAVLTAQDSVLVKGMPVLFKLQPDKWEHKSYDTASCLQPSCPFCLQRCNHQQHVTNFLALVTSPTGLVML